MRRSYSSAGPPPLRHRNRPNKFTLNTRRRTRRNDTSSHGETTVVRVGTPRRLSRRRRDRSGTTTIDRPLPRRCIVRALLYTVANMCRVDNELDVCNRVCGTCTKCACAPVAASPRGSFRFSPCRSRRRRLFPALEVLDTETMMATPTTCLPPHEIPKISGKTSFFKNGRGDSSPPPTEPKEMPRLVKECAVLYSLDFGTRKK